MKFLKNKYFVASLTSFVIFFIASFFILSASIPDNVFVSQSESEGEWIPQKWQWIVRSRKKSTAPAMENSSKSVAPESDAQSLTETVYLCGIVPVKNVNLCITDNMKIIPGGDCIGIDLKTHGLLVVATEEFESSSSKVVCPGKEAGMKSGDVIEKINGTPVNRISQIQEIILSSSEEIRIEGTRDSKPKEWTVYPQTDKNGNENRIGLWLRESVAGVGTVTFYHDGIFGALGHEIADSDTGERVSTAGGTICSAAIIGIEKGEKGVPGALKGIFTGEENGKIAKNSPVGIFGTIKSIPTDSKPLAPASRKEICTGKAQIICDLGNGKKTYSAEIQKIFPAGTNTKSMIIHITDKELIEKTGGIVQGMSGSPILQNGRIVGAVTHVFVNDPTRGYGIFIENMLAEAEKIK